MTMFYKPQNASFMHISSAVNAIEDDYVTLGYFVKSKDGRFKIHFGNAIFFQICIIFCFFFSFEGPDIHFSENGLYKNTFVTF